MINFATDLRLSVSARGVMAYLLASNLEAFSVEEVKAAGVGRDKAYSILSELRAAGYAINSGNSWKWLKSYEVSGNPEIRKSGKSYNHIHDLISRDLISNTDQIEQIEEFPENPEATTQLPENQEVLNQLAIGEVTQPPLISLTEETSMCVAPAAPKKVKRLRPDEEKALDDPLWAITAAPRKQTFKFAIPKTARWLLEEYQATPTQVSGFWDWFRRHTTAAQMAAKERRQVSPPTLKQITDLWPQFLTHWQAEQERLAKEAQEEQEIREAREAIAARRRLFLERQKAMGLVA